MDEEDLLAILANERKNSIGFDHDDTLAKERETALNYAQGVMDDIPALANRSKAVATVVSDAVETILPDLVEIFTGEDVATFAPKGPEDDEAAKQETDYIQHVFFDQNPGFMVLYSMFKDACLTKTGVVKWRWEPTQYGETEVFENRTAIEAQSLQQHGEIVRIDPQEEAPGQVEPLFTVELRQVVSPGCVKVEAFPPEDFTVGADTVRLADATYCALRTRRRAQDLVLEGVPAEVVERLSAYNETDEAIEIARDTADESEERPEAAGGLRMVEVVEHYIRLDGKLLRIMTGNDESVLIDQEEVEEKAADRLRQAEAHKTLAEGRTAAARDASAIRDSNDAANQSTRDQVKEDHDALRHETDPAVRDDVARRRLCVLDPGACAA